MKSVRYYSRSVLLLLSTIAIYAHVSVIAQTTDLNWSQQEKIPDYYYDSFAPYLVADQNHTVHAFQYVGLKNLWDSDSYLAIFYRQWRLDTGWSTPIDILLPPSTAPELGLYGVSLD